MIDPSIYGLLDTKGLQSGLLNIGDQYMAGQESKNRLSQLARQNELTDMQIRAGQRAELAAPEQKRQKDLQELSAALSFGIQQPNGISNQELMDRTFEEAKRRGLQDEDVAQLFQPWANVRDQTDGQAVSNIYAQKANPQEALKQQLEAQFRKPASVTPSQVSTLMKERAAMAAANPNDPNLAILDQAIQKSVTPQQFMQVATGLGGEQSLVTAPRTAGGRPTVTPLGITKPQAAGKGGTPEEKAIMKEQTSLSSQQVLDQAEKLFKHPGRQAGTGASAWMGKIPGTEAKGFSSNLETFKSQTFLPMVSALKGMGALSDAEGKKITASVGALDPEMPEKEFEESLKDTTRFLFSKAKAAGLDVQMPSFIESREKPKGGAKFLGFE